jgi:hypothetical protein
MARFQPTDDEVKALQERTVTAKQIAEKHGVAVSTVTRYPATKAGKAQVRRLNDRARDAERQRRNRAEARARERGDDRPEDERYPAADSGRSQGNRMRVNVDMMKRLNAPVGQGQPPQAWLDRTKLVPQRELHSDLLRIVSPDCRSRIYIERDQLPRYQERGWTLLTVPGQPVDADE